MVTTLCICGVTVVAEVLAILIKPQIRFKKIQIGTYWLIALIGAIILFSTNSITIKEFFSAITANTAVNPLKILVLFISMTLMSVFLDSVGFFKYFATLAIKKANKSQIKLFLLLYIMVSVLTIFTSNDIIILTFTPFICYFAKEAKINPIPFLVAEFVSANTWSMFLIIGNPTNIFLASSQNIPFLKYIGVMALPTLFAGIASFLMLLLVFRKQLKGNIEYTAEEHLVLPDKPLTIIGVVHLALCLILLIISSYIGFEMWYISLGFCVSMFIVATIYKLVRKEKLREVVVCFKHAPWQLIPFALSMFVLVLALEKCGFTHTIASFLGEEETILTYGASSFLASNVINNIPMSVLFSSVLNELNGINLTKAVYATVIGSNIGAFLTPLGALAGIMFSSLANSHGIKFSFLTFVKYGVLIAIPTLFAALAGLYCIL